MGIDPRAGGATGVFAYQARGAGDDQPFPRLSTTCITHLTHFPQRAAAFFIAFYTRETNNYSAKNGENFLAATTDGVRNLKRKIEKYKLVKLKGKLNREV